MSRPNRVLGRHRTLWLSDIHLGSPSCQAAKVVHFLRQNECEQLYLVGDIFDGWRLKSRFYWTPDHSRVIKAILDKARRGTEVHYLTGNHDDFMRQFVRRAVRLGHLRVAHETVHTTADGRRLLVLHGDVFDAVTTHHPWISFAGMVGYEALIRANGLINRVRRQFAQPPLSLSAFVKRHVKEAVQYLSGFDEAVHYRCRRDQLDGLVCGHTHQAEVRYLRDGIVCYNSGDWVESCTALAEGFDGSMHLLNFEALIEPVVPHTVRRARRSPRRTPVPRHRIVVPPDPREAPAVPAVATPTASSTSDIPTPPQLH